MVSNSSKELVRRAIHMQSPERIPVMRNREVHYPSSDILYISVGLLYEGSDHEHSEWGYRWIDRNPNLTYSASEPNLTSWELWNDIQWPDPANPRRFDHCRDIVSAWGSDRYMIGCLNLTGFTNMCLLRGTENLYIDFYEEPENVDMLADKVFGIEEDILRLLPAQGFDAAAFEDDYGTQKGLMISPDMWRRFIKPRLRHEFELAHSLGLDVYLHSCGRIIDIIPDLIEIGVDVLNLGQVSLNGVEELGKRFAGKLCFCCPVSYQTTAIAGTAEGIAAEVRDFAEHLNTERGGLILIANKNDELHLKDDVIERAVLGVTTFRK